MTNEEGHPRAEPGACDARRDGESAPGKPLRLLVVMPSWVGDVVMATPALALLRQHLRASFIGALVRPGLDELLAGSALADGSPLVDEFHVERSKGVMGPKVVASRIRPRRYDAALLLTNSFSTALITRLAFIPRRVGYDRDGRGLLLTQRLTPRLRNSASLSGNDESRGAGGGGWRWRLGRDRYALEPAVEYYLRAARSFLTGRDESSGPEDGDEARMTLGVTPTQRALGAEVLARAGIGAGEPFALINPGANNPAKRWPGERFGEIGAGLVRERGLWVLVTGSPDERDLVERVAAAVNDRLAVAGGGPSGVGGMGGAGERRAVALTSCGVTLGALKAILSERGCLANTGAPASPSRCRVLITNDTGPRHIAAAFGVPTVTLFGPTDPRWTTLPPGQHRFANVVADPDLPPEMLADDHPERCAIEKISVERVRDALAAVLG